MKRQYISMPVYQNNSIRFPLPASHGGLFTCAGLVTWVGLLNPENLCVVFILRQKESRMLLTAVNHRILTSLRFICMMFSFFQTSFLEVEHTFY